MKIFKSALAVAALMSSTSAFANPLSWSISESSGAVSIMRPGITLAGVRGKALAAGDVIATGKTGRAVLVRGGEYLMVSTNSRITIAQPKVGSMTQIVQSFGNAVFKINKKATPHFAVQTPYLAAVVKGTTFSVTVTETGASVQVTEGRVEVQTPDGGATHMVTPGEIGLVRAGMPGRLVIQGDNPVTIDSPNAPVAATVVDTAAAAEPSKEDMVAVEEKSSTTVIAEAIGEGAVDLGKASGGMVFGDSTLVASVSPALIKEAPQPAVTPAPVDILNESLPQPLPPTPADSPPAEAVEPMPPTLLPPVDVAEAPDQKPPVLIESNPVEPTPPQPVVDLLPPPPVKPDVFVDSLPSKLDPSPDILVPADPPIDPAPQNNGNNGNGNGNGNGNNGNGNNGNGVGNGGPSVP